MTSTLGRFLERVRSGPRLRVAVLVVVILAAVLVSAFLEGDLPEFLGTGTRGLRAFMRHYSYAPGFALLYIEESGIPLPAPGDVFVLYVGAHVPRNLFAWISAWLGLIIAVTLGATNLFYVSKRWGRQLAESRVAEYVHLSPERLARAEKWFKRYGALAIIFGRHIPGFRVPITVACGVFKVPYLVFAPCVAVSTAIWAGVVIIIGINFGNRLENFLRLHTQMYFAWGALVVLLVVVQFFRSRRDQARRRRPVEPSTAR
ncbi:MAG: DedA family protein [Candidatus Dormibacterales bacterium]